MQKLKRILSMALCIAMLASFFAGLQITLVTAENGTNDKNISTSSSVMDPNTLYINGAYDESISIKKDASSEADFDGKLKLAGANVTVERDYSQKCSVEVSNTSDGAIKYYLTCINLYDDIAVNFVEEGSKDHPIIIQSGETQNVELSIFTQNAELENYELPIYAYIVNDSAPVATAPSDTSTADSKTTVYLSCNQPKWNVSCELTKADPVTLAQNYSLKNNGENITDLCVSVEGEAAEYVKYYPYIANYQLDSNDSVSFALSPDLAKMKLNNLSKTEGMLIIKSGANKDEQPIVFDTNGAEITTTTMGELGLTQDSNPYVNLKLDEDSIKSTISVNGEDKTFEEIIGDKTIEDITADDINGIFEEMVNAETDYCFDISDSADYTYGENGERLTVVTRVYVTSENNSEVQVAAGITGDGYTYDPETGTVTITDTKKYNSQEYEFLFAEICEKVGGGINIPGAISKIVIPEDHGDFQVHVEKKIISKVWKNATEDIDIVQNIDYINKGLEVYGYISDAVKVGSVVSNPNYDNGTKITYTGLVVAKNVVKALTPVVSAHPVGFLASVVAEYCIDEMIGDMEDIFDLRDGSAIYYDMYGSQCTNMGSVTSDFYVPNYVSGNDEVKLYETGRMYDGTPFSGNYYDESLGGNTYIHDYDTSYDFYLNGEKIGNTVNGGLTEVNCVELPTDKLKYGANNELRRVYHTNQGHYLVTTDTELTLVYPNDAEIGYIGSVDGLEDVRLHPDFAIYTENVYLESETAIVGEANRMSFNVYNRGSQSGWVTVTVTENGNDVFKQENVFIEAFSSSNFSFDWTPSSEKNNVEITLENKTGYIDERKDTNNYVSKIIPARQRQVPEILSLNPTDGLAEEDICLYVDVKNTADIMSVCFYIDDVKSEGTPVKTVNSDGMGRYSLIVPPLSPGRHKIKAEIEYYTSGTGTALAETTGEINISADNKISFAVDETIVNPKYIIAKYNEETYDYEFEDAIVTDSENGMNALKLSSSMKKEPESYRLLVACDGGFLNMSLSEMTEGTKTLSLNNNKELKFELSSGNVKIDSVTIRAVDGIYINENIVLTGKNIYKIQPGVYKLSVRISVDDTDSGYVQSSNIYLSDDVDLNGDCMIDLSDYVLEYTFAMPDVDFNTLKYANVNMVYSIDGETYTYYMDAVINPQEKTISCIEIGDRSAEIINEAKDAMLYICLPAEQSLYKVDIKNPEIPTALYRNDLVKVNFKTDRKTILKSLNVINDEKIAMGAYSDLSAMYLPKESFEYISVFENNGITYSVKDKFDLSDAENDYDIELKAENYDFATVKFDLPQLAEITKLEYEVDDFSTVGFVDIADRQEIMMPIGSIPIQVWYGNENNDDSTYYSDYFDIKYTVDVKRDTENIVSVGNEFDGSISYFYADSDYSEGARVYSGGKEFSIHLSELKDKNGGTLNHYYANNVDKYLSGTATFTSVSNPEEKYEVAVSGSDLYSIEGVMPNVDGEFNLTVALSNVGVKPEGLFVSATAGEGGSIEPPGITEVKSGDSVTYKISADSGYRIADVLVDGNSVGAKDTYTFENIIESHTISAIFEKRSGNVSSGWSDVSSFTTTTAAPKPEPAATVTPNTPNSTFTDVNQSDWFYTAVTSLYSQGVIKGTSDTTFSPDDYTTRAAVMTMLYRMNGSPESGAADIFSDVPFGEWYTNAVIWGANAGIVSGNGDGTFAPDKAVTREELVKMIVGYAEYEGEALSERDITGFADASAVSDWAVPFMQKAYGSGIISGYPEDNTIRPQGTATRAELAQIIYNLSK